MLSLNIAKTHFVTIAKNRHIENVNIYLDACEVAQKSHAKFLGFTVAREARMASPYKPL